MLLLNKQTTKSLLLAKLLASVFAFLFISQATAQSNQIISSSNSSSVSGNSIQSTPNSSVTLDFSLHTAESWDTQDDANNVVEHCINGSTITGFEFSNVTMQSVAGSFFSETVFYFSDSNQGDDTGIKFKMGAGNDTSGTAVFNSNGIFDITDSGIPDDLFSLSDGQFILQIFEDIDDKPNEIDTIITNGTMTIWGVDLTAVEGCSFIENSASTTVDLSLSYTTVTAGTEIGEALDISLLISNIGNDEATHVTMQNLISDNLNFIDLSCDDGSSTTDRTQLSNFSTNNIAGQSSLSCLLKTEINEKGSFTIDATVNADSDLDNNNNSVNIILGPATAKVPVNSLWLLLTLSLFIIISNKKRFNLH